MYKYTISPHFWLIKTHKLVPSSYECETLGLPTDRTLPKHGGGSASEFHRFPLFYASL